MQSGERTITGGFRPTLLPSQVSARSSLLTGCMRVQLGYVLCNFRRCLSRLWTYLACTTMTAVERKEWTAMK